jgi:hypothetical protein
MYTEILNKKFSRINQPIPDKFGTNSSVKGIQVCMNKPGPLQMGEDKKKYAKNRAGSFENVFKNTEPENFKMKLIKLSDIVQN